MNLTETIYKIVEKLHLPLNEQQLTNLVQFIKFGIVGVSNTLVNYVAYVLSLYGIRLAAQFEMDYIVAQGIAFVISVLWSFYWNNRFVFTIKEDEKRSLWKSLVKTFISYSFTGLLLSSVLLIVWVKWLGISEYIAPILNLIITVPLNFLINKFWAFKSE